MWTVTVSDRTIWPVVAELINARHRQGLTQRGLAARMHARQGYLADWERGQREPSLTSLYRWADALGYTITLTTGGDP